MTIKIYDSIISLAFAPVIFMTTFATQAQTIERDLEAGRQVYASCMACHSLERDRTGPRHCGLFGRKAGAVPGFEYSSAMHGASIIWDKETLYRFLESPLKVMPGTTMGFAGIKDTKKRRDLITYLQSVSDSEKICN